MRTVSGVPRAIGVLDCRRISTSASCLSKPLAMMQSPAGLTHLILASTRIRRWSPDHFFQLPGRSVCRREGPRCVSEGLDRGPPGSGISAGWNDGPARAGGDDGMTSLGAMGAVSGDTADGLIRRDLRQQVRENGRIADQVAGHLDRASCANPACPPACQRPSATIAAGFPPRRCDRAPAP